MKKRIRSLLFWVIVSFALFPACAPQTAPQSPAAEATHQAILPVLSGEGQPAGEAYPGTGSSVPTPAVGSQPYPPPASAGGAYPAPSAPSSPIHGSGETLRLAVLPIIDALPLFVAQREGLFSQFGVRVEFVPVASAAERDQVIIAGQAEGMINDIVSTLLYNKEGVQVQIVRLARVATPESAQYHIVVSATSGIGEIGQLRGVPIGISQGTIIEYITDRLLEREGLQPQEIQKIAVPKIPDRLSLLASGELKAATLPDPFSYLAVQQGSRILLQDAKYPEYGHSTYTFRKVILEQKPQAIRAFLAAIEEAVERINRSPEQYGEVLVEEKLIPAPLAGSYRVPFFPPKGIPDERLWNDVLAWATAKGIVSGPVSYADSVNGTLLP